jgi:hypothetical protein
MWLGGRHRKLDLRPVGSRGHRFASHRFDRWPVLTKEVRCVVVVVRLHSDAAGLSAGAVRYLKVKVEADSFRILVDRLIIAAHLVSPPFCVAHSRFIIWIFVRRDYGALESADVTGRYSAHDYGGYTSSYYVRPTMVLGTGVLSVPHTHIAAALATIVGIVTIGDRRRDDAPTMSSKGRRDNLRPF